MIPGLTIKKVSLKRASWGFASLLSVCQATSMAMTTVLPDPVAILRASRGKPGFEVSFASRMSFSIQASPNFLATSVMKMRVSRASIWQKKSLRSRPGSDQ